MDWEKLGIFFGFLCAVVQRRFPTLRFSIPPLINLRMLNDSTWNPVTKEKICFIHTDNFLDPPGISTNKVLNSMIPDIIEGSTGEFGLHDLEIHKVQYRNSLSSVISLIISCLCADCGPNEIQCTSWMRKLCFSTLQPKKWIQCFVYHSVLMVNTSFQEA